MKGPKVLKLWLILMCFTWSHLLLAEDNILYVKPGVKPIPEINAISTEINKKIQAKIPLIKYTLGYLDYSNEHLSNYNTIKSLSLNYVLRLSNVVKRGSLYELSFSFASIDIDKQVKGKKIEEDPITWDNSIYITSKEANNTFSNIDEILEDIRNEIDFYLKNRYFRPRIYIDPKLFGPDETSSIIEFNNFCNWLEKTMQTTANEKKYNYVIYFRNKKIYPDKASLKLYGQFVPIQDDEARINVILKIQKNDNTFQRQPVKIYIDDFNTGNYTNEDAYKQKVVTYIYELCATESN
jgi:hypothetical protein